MNKSTTSSPVSGLQYQDSIMPELTDTQTHDDIIFQEIHELSQMDDLDGNSLFKVVRKDNACRLIKLNTQIDFRTEKKNRISQIIRRLLRFINKKKMKNLYYFIHSGERYFDVEVLPIQDKEIRIRSARIKGKLDLLFHRDDFFAWVQKSGRKLIFASDIGQIFQNEFSEWLTAAVKSVENLRLLKQYRENAVNWEKQDRSRLPVWFTVLEVTDLKVDVQLNETESFPSSSPETAGEKPSGNWFKKRWNWVVSKLKKPFSS